MTDTLTRETYAATYATSNALGEFGVDLIEQDVERDSEGREMNREEAGWSWHVAPGFGHQPRLWIATDADDLLTVLGWRRTADWTWRSDLGGCEGWDAPVERLA